MHLPRVKGIATNRTVSGVGSRLRDWWCPDRRRRAEIGKRPRPRRLRVRAPRCFDHRGRRKVRAARFGPPRKYEARRLDQHPWLPVAAAFFPSPGSAGPHIVIPGGFDRLHGNQPPGLAGQSREHRRAGPAARATRAGSRPTADDPWFQGPRMGCRVPRGAQRGPHADGDGSPLPGGGQPL